MISFERFALLAAILASVGFHFVVVARMRFHRGPQTVFVLLGFGVSTAVVVTADFFSPAQTTYACYVTAGLASFVLGTFVAAAAARFKPVTELTRFAEQPWDFDIVGQQYRTIVFIGVVSIAVTVFYYVSVGYFVPLESMRMMLSGDEASAIAAASTELRRDAHQSRYTAPGYAMQFKDWLLSLTCILFYFRVRAVGTYRARILFVLFFLVAVLGLIGTGRRQGLAFFIVGFLFVSTGQAARPFDLPRRQAVVTTVLLFVLFGGLTAMLGRESASIGTIVAAPLAIVDRAFVSPASEQLQVFSRVLFTMSPSWGGGWLESLLGVLPGKRVNLANELHAMMYGNVQGNLGLNVWSSYWLNFGWLGLAVAALYGALLQSYYIWIIRGRKGVVRVVVLTYAGVVLGLSEEPYTMLVNGFGTMLIFLILAELSRRIVSARRRPPLLASARPTVQSTALKPRRDLSSG